MREHYRAKWNDKLVIVEVIDIFLGGFVKYGEIMRAGRKICEFDNR